MLDNIKYLMTLKIIDKNIFDGNFDIALEKLNFLIREEYRPSITYLKRGRLCKKLLMYEEAYSDFTYVINNCSNKTEAYYERLFLNYEIANFYEALKDANLILTWNNENFDVKRIKFLALIFTMQINIAQEYLMEIFEYNKYRAIQFLFNEVALTLAQNEYSKAIKILELIDSIDENNPIKLLKESTIFGLVGDKEKQKEIINKIEQTFPKYFVSHFRFADMYEEKDLLEISFLLELEIFDKQGLFLYPFRILEGYKNHIEGHIIDAKECFEKAIKINPTKPEAYVLLAQTMQLMSGYNNPEYKKDAEENYQKAMEIYQRENLSDKVEDMKRQLKHLNSNLSFK